MNNIEINVYNPKLRILSLAEALGTKFTKSLSCFQLLRLNKRRIQEIQEKRKTLNE